MNGGKLCLEDVIVAKGQLARKTQPMVDTNNVSLIVFASASGDTITPTVVYPDAGTKANGYVPQRNLTLEMHYPSDWAKVCSKFGFSNAPITMRAIERWETESR